MKPVKSLSPKTVKRITAGLRRIRRAKATPPHQQGRAPTAARWWKVSTSQRCWYINGTQAQAEELRRHKARWHGCAARKEAMPRGWKPTMSPKIIAAVQRYRIFDADGYEMGESEGASKQEALYHLYEMAGKKPNRAEVERLVEGRLVTFKQVA